MSVPRSKFHHQFLHDCEYNGEILGKQVPPSNYLVPTVFRDLSPNSFNPRVVSIGPLHTHDQHLQEFEVQKTTYLHNLLHRLGISKYPTFEECATKVREFIVEIRACYAGSTTYSDVELARMMVIDSCFILEFIYGLSDVSSGRNMLITQSIIYDLLLIENQIPLFILEMIFECTIMKTKLAVSLASHLKVLLNYYYIFHGHVMIPDVNLATSHDHILGFVHTLYQPADPNPYSSVSIPLGRIPPKPLPQDPMPSISEDPVPSTSISIPPGPMSSMLISNPKGHSAIDLARVGMCFKPNKDKKKRVMAMKLELPIFSWFPWLGRKPTLSMPTVSINDFTELVLRNLIIYEQFTDVKKYVTAYASAMDMLIDTPEDVAVLVKSNVLNNDLGSNEKAANMINNICKEVPVAEFFYHQQWEKMDAYYNSYWPNTIAGLKRTYFNNPWSIIALFAAFALFALTVVQTIFDINTK